MIDIWDIKLVSYNFPPYLLLIIINESKFNYVFKRKTSKEEEVDYVEGRFQGEMDEREEFRCFFRVC